MTGVPPAGAGAGGSDDTRDLGAGRDLGRPGDGRSGGQDGPGGPSGPGWERLEDQIAWHDRKAKSNQQWYRGLKVAQISTGALIPVLAGIGGLSWLVAILGALVVINESVNQLFRFHDSWLNYRATCESLRRERFLYLCAAAPYAGKSAPMPLLSERVEAILGRATKEWTAAQVSTGRRDRQE